METAVIAEAATIFFSNASPEAELMETKEDCFFSPFLCSNASPEAELMETSLEVE